MISLASLLVVGSSALGALAAAIDFDHPSNVTSLEKRTTVTTSTTGTAGGYYYSCYIESNGGATMDINTGQYSLTWEASATDVVAGIGWNPGSAQAITYSGTFNAPGNAYLSVYGWTTSPLVEYYITDSYGDYNPSSGLTSLGTVTSDGGTYNIYSTVRTNAPSIQGTATFNQYWSIRTEHRVGGTITTSNHFNAWKSHGMAMGAFNYQILATEGYESTGSSSITVSAGGGGGTTTTAGGGGGGTTTSSAPPSGATQVEWGQCGGIGWTGPTVCASPYTCTYSSAYYSQCL